MKLYKSEITNYLMKVMSFAMETIVVITLSLLVLGSMLLLLYSK